MANVDNLIYNLARQLCRNLPEDIPEGLLYGFIKMVTMDEEALKELLTKGRVEDVGKCIEDLKSAKQIVDDRGLDENLLKNGLQLVISKRARDAEVISAFAETIKNYNESTPVTTLVNDALTGIPDEELEVFKEGKSLSDIASYSKTLSVNTPEETGAGQGKESQSPSEDTGSKESADSDSEQDSAKREEEFHYELYSDVLRSYIENLQKVIPAFKARKNESLLWSQSLLISIDDGYGLTTFVKAMANVFRENGLSAVSDLDSMISKIKIDDIGSEEERYKGWSRLVSEVENMSRYSQADNKLVRIMCIDISKWLGELNTTRIKEYLTRLDEGNSRALYVFRVPYMEHRIIQQITSTVSDIITVRPIIVPPVETDQMLLYMKKKADQYGFSFADGCDDILERGIVAEKNDGSFYGFNTLAKMVVSIIYDKISDLADSQDDEPVIKPDELKKYLNTSIDERSADEMIAQMVGVKPIIDQVNALINQIKVQQEMSAHGQQLDRPTIHMIFTGSPGTGKTTMARIIAKKMKEAGILSKGNFYEIKGRDLCGRYIGETTPKTSAYCRSAYGSVLFIDEAYELYRGAGDNKDYGREAITALVAEMENHRDDMCVIMAGYTDEMNTLLESNPGLKSRIRTSIEFPNYSREELEGIFYSMIGDNFDCDEAFRETVHEYFDNLDDDVIEDKEFANGRFVRNLYENTWGTAAIRHEFDEAGRLKLKATDFTSATEKTDASSAETNKRRPMGFGAF